MRQIKLLLIITLSISLLTCERDDLCPETTLTTPSMNIGFFNETVQESPKTVNNLYIADIANNMVLDGFNNINEDEATLPLRTDQDQTQFLFIKDYSLDNNGTPNDTSDDIIDGIIDVVTISYTREDVYVSRACGYKTIFKNVIVTVDPGLGEPWISFTQPLNDNLTIEDEFTTHYFFYH